MPQQHSAKPTRFVAILATEYSQQLADKEIDLRKRAKMDAQAVARTEIVVLQRKLQESERNARREAEHAAMEAVKQSRREIDLVKERAHTRRRLRA